MTTDIVTLTEAKAQLQIRSTTTTYDTELAFYISAASQKVDQLAADVAQRTVTAALARRLSPWALLLAETPVISLTSLDPIDGSATYDVTALWVDPAGTIRRKDRGVIVGGPFTATYTAGRATAPELIKLACLMLLQHLWETQRGSPGPPVAATRLDVGGDAGAVNSGVWIGVPNKVRELLKGESPDLAAI